MFNLKTLPEAPDSARADEAVPVMQASPKAS